MMSGSSRLVAERLEKEFGEPLSERQRERLLQAMPGLKPRAKTIVELAQKARFYVAPRPIPLAADATKALTPEARDGSARSARRWRLSERRNGPRRCWKPSLRRFAESERLKLGAIAQPLRAALTGSLASPGLFEVMEVLGREESLARIEDAARA